MLLMLMHLHVNLNADYDGPINVLLRKCRAISLITESSFIPMSSSIHLKCVLALPSLTRLCKTVNGAPTYR